MSSCDGNREETQKLFPFVKMAENHAGVHIYVKTYCVYNLGSIIITLDEMCRIFFDNYDRV